MAFLDNFISKFAGNQGTDEDNELKKINSEREKLKRGIRENLKNMGFNQGEVSEVFSIIDVCFTQMEDAKVKLIKAPPGSDLAPIAKEVKDEVSKITKQMYISLKLKVSEIRARKGQE